MTKQHQPTRVANVTPAVDIPPHRFVNWSWAQAGADDDCMGVSREKLEAGYPGVVVLGETAIVEAGTAIDGAVIQLKSDATGRAIEATNGDAVQAVLKPGQTAAAAGEFIEVYLTNHISSVPV